MAHPDTTFHLTPTILLPALQFPGRTLPREFEFGGNAQKGHATMGMPNGANASNPGSPLRAHEKEPVLPARE